MPTSERVLCIPTERLEQVGEFFGFVPVTDNLHAKLFDPVVFSFRPRSDVETDPAFKQLIPYAVLRHDGRVFHYRRGEKGTETRLHTKRSVGIGGHISADDAAATGDAYTTGMLRELHEEVSIGTPFSNRLLGFLYDPRTPVGEVHLGVFHLLDLESPNVLPREAAISNAGFADLEVLKCQCEEFETWSQFVLPVL